MTLKSNDVFSLPIMVLAKRSYIEFYYAHPETGLPVRFRISEHPQTGSVNRCKTVTEKQLTLTALQKIYEDQLLDGWVPPKFKGFAVAKRKAPVTIITAINEAMANRQKVLAETSWPPYKNSLIHFKDWLRQNQLHVLKPQQIETEHIYNFLCYLKIARNVKNRTRNNYLTDLRTTFNEFKLINKTWLITNPCFDIPKLIDKSDTHQLHSTKDLELIMPWMKVHEPYLYEYCRFFVYLGCRPVEATRIKVRNINLENNTVDFRAPQEKTDTRKVKKIFALHLPDFAQYDLENTPKDYFYFTAQGKPGPKGTTRDYFTSHFEKVKKHFGLPANQTMYALRHTFMVSLFKNCKDFNELGDVMKITGHKTLGAFQAYIQKYLDEPGKDLSHLVTNTFI